MSALRSIGNIFGMRVELQENLRCRHLQPVDDAKLAPSPAVNVDGGRQRYLWSKSAKGIHRSYSRSQKCVRRREAGNTELLAGALTSEGKAIALFEACAHQTFT